MLLTIRTLLPLHTTASSFCSDSNVVPMQVSEGMRSLGASLNLLTIAIGTYLASALNKAVAAVSPDDLWVANNPLFGHYDW